jgi:hypothetical protein
MLSGIMLIVVAPDGLLFNYKNMTHIIKYSSVPKAPMELFGRLQAWLEPT